VTGGCLTSVAALDSIYVDDEENLMFGSGVGWYWALVEGCISSAQITDPLFRSEANENYFLQDSSPAMVDTMIGQYHLVRRWGALPKASGPADVLDIQVPPFDSPVGMQPGERYALTGFEFANSSNLDAVVNYRLHVVGGVLDDNGDPLSLVGTSPVLAPGESFVPPPAALIVPETDGAITVKYAYAYAPALNLVDTVSTSIQFGTPLSVRVTSFHGVAEGNGVRLTWRTGAGFTEEGWLVYRAVGDGVFHRVTPVTLPAGTRTFVDDTARPGDRYRYRLVVLDPGESFAAEIEIQPTVLLALEQNIPNPFNPQTAIRFSLPSTAIVRLSIYDVRGARVRTLVDERLDGGAYREEWDGRDGRGHEVASGVYFCRLTVGTRTLTRKMVLAR
jgi:hypothetical protein